MKSINLPLMDIINLNSGILELKDLDTKLLKAQPDKWVGLSKRLMYALVITKNSIKSEIEAVAAMEEQTPGIQEFESKRVNLAKAYAIKDANGDPISTNNTYQIVNENISSFNDRFSELKEKYKDHLDKWEISKKEIDSKLKEKVDVNVYQVPIDLLPDTIPMSIFEKLTPILVVDQSSDT